MEVLLLHDVVVLKSERYYWTFHVVLNSSSRYTWSMLSSRLPPQGSNFPLVYRYTKEEHIVSPVYLDYTVNLPYSSSSYLCSAKSNPFFSLSQVGSQSDQS